ncbi:CbtA family protein, partial [Microlunatus flavus]
DHGDAAGGHDHGTAGGTEVPRSLQSTAGLATATVVAGVTLGGLVGAVSALAMGRFGRLGTRGVPLLVAGLGFVAVYLVPFLTYPPNPPAVGQADTIGYRTELYFLLVAISVIAGVTAVLVARRVAPRWGTWYAVLVCAAGYAVVVGLAGSLVPTYDEVPEGFPASLLYEFRKASLLVQVTLWGVIGLATAELAHRLAVRGRRPERSRPLVDA